MNNERFSVTGLVGVDPPHIKEYAYNAGMMRPDQEWLCTDYDSWVRNPHYRGPPGRHPEDDYED